jgi:beta-glucanase (GH16 family)
MFTMLPLASGLLALQPAARPAAAADDGGWTLVWGDEFEACPNGRPDPKKWGFENGMVRNHEAQWYQPDNAVCDGGKLVISAERVTPSPDKGNAQYTSSSLITRETAQWQYGRMDMRGRIDVRSGSWPAWWTLGNDTGTIGWPECGEIDIMEYYRTLMHGNIMYSDRRKQAHWSTKTIIVGQEWASTFHNWSMWVPAAIPPLLTSSDRESHFVLTRVLVRLWQVLEPNQALTLPRWLRNEHD